VKWAAAFLALIPCLLQGAPDASRAFRFVGADPAFAPYERAFLEDWGFRRSTRGQSIRIVQDPKLHEEEFRLQLASTITLTISKPQGLAWGLQALGQAITFKAKNSDIQVVPPATKFRCVMLDVARRYHSPSTLRNLIRWCQIARIRYVQLHLTDDQNWMFPTEVLAGIDAGNTHRRPAYTLKELRELRAYASSRGVTLIPEIDIPGHSTLLNRLNPTLFKIQGSASANCLDFASEEGRGTLKNLLTEVALTFPNSPYIHIGGDEAWYPTPEKDPDFAARLTNGATPNTVFLDFVAEMAQHVIRQGKTPLIWEGFGPSEYAKTHLPKQAVVVAWEGIYYPVNALIRDGFKVINAGWDPNYVVNHYPYESFTLAPLERMFDADGKVFGTFDWSDPERGAVPFSDTKNLEGSMLCWWEGHEWNAQKTLPARILAFGTRLWGEKLISYPEFLGRYNRLELDLRSRLYPFEVKTKGMVAPGQFRAGGSVQIVPKSDDLEIAWRTNGNIPTYADLQPRRTFPVTNTTNQVIVIQAFRGKRAVGEPRFFPAQMVSVVPNLALRCPVSSLCAADPQFPVSCLTDGIADSVSSFWLAYPNPQFATIDLRTAQPINRIQVVGFYAANTTTSYRVSISTDNKTWTQVIDAANQKEVGKVGGYEHRISPVTARYVRLETLGGSLFPSTMTRIHEIRVFNDTPPPSLAKIEVAPSLRDVHVNLAHR
jgi:hexosaminidase